MVLETENMKSICSYFLAKGSNSINSEKEKSIFFFLAILPANALFKKKDRYEISVYIFFPFFIMSTIVKYRL
jgi:hypothetical protein